MMERGGDSSLTDLCSPPGNEHAAAGRSGAARLDPSVLSLGTTWDTLQVRAKDSGMIKEGAEDGIKGNHLNRLL